MEYLAWWESERRVRRNWCHCGGGATPERGVVVDSGTGCWRNGEWSRVG